LTKAYPTKAIGTPRTRAVRTDLNENTETFICLSLILRADLEAFGPADFGLQLAVVD
jgi:hypothetical protein